MIALPTSAVAENLVATVGCLDSRHFFRDLLNRHFPRDGVVTAISPATLRLRDAVFATLIEVDLGSLVADVAPRRRMVAITLNLNDRAAIFAASFHQDAAVGVTQVTGRWLPIAILFCYAFAHFVLRVYRLLFFFFFAPPAASLVQVARHPSTTEMLAPVM